MPQLLDDIARDLRAAVLGSEYGEATRLSEEYAQAVQREWGQMGADDRATSGLPKQANELLTWARNVAIMHHAMAGQHLAAMETAHRYLNARAQYTESSAV